MGNDMITPVVSSDARICSNVSSSANANVSSATDTDNKMQARRSSLAQGPKPGCRRISQSSLLVNRLCACERLEREPCPQLQNRKRSFWMTL